MFRRATTTIYNRFNRWRKAGVWDRLMDAITKRYDGDVQMMDTSFVRAHQVGATGKGGAELGKSGHRAQVDFWHERGLIAVKRSEYDGRMRRNHSAAFKPKVAQAAINGEKTLADSARQFETCGSEDAA